MPSLPLIPNDINRAYFAGPVFQYLRVTRDDILAAGLLTADEWPADIKKGNRVHPTHGYRFHFCPQYPGRFNVHIMVSKLSAEPAFQRFLGGLLADTRLSLVKGESHV